MSFQNRFITHFQKSAVANHLFFFFFLSHFQVLISSPAQCFPGPVTCPYLHAECFRKEEKVEILTPIVGDKMTFEDVCRESTMKKGGVRSEMRYY